MKITFNANEIQVFEERAEDGSVTSLHFMLGNDARNALDYVRDLGTEYYNGRMLVSTLRSLESEVRVLQGNITFLESEVLSEKIRRAEALKHPAVAEALQHYETMSALAQEANP